MQVIGIDTIGAMLKEIAEFLNLPDSKLYTGHSFRVTSVTMLANAGCTSVILQNHGGWNSAKVAQGYVANSVNNKRKICDQIMQNMCENTSCNTSATEAMKKLKLNKPASLPSKASVNLQIDGCSLQ